MAHQVSKTCVVVIKVNHRVKTALLKGLYLGRVRRKLSLTLGNMITIHINGHADVTQSGHVFGHVHVKAFETLIIVDHEHQGPGP